ncbi:hypothetical protein [Campylobacter corcagiensis]|uniref:Uncharacterized protein n=1 Tax=Campylobacter corcagiensis TaxID=1448857 RepID=A0A7M1LFE6_9BACT|nr:hypothetical protein [Campylobacter corcagiensis]QKF64524.1 hypothetical protein CCORG_0658 [Campylobacter corcagiensis]QOQ87299.1 hypothetical protein IMC76_00270 [Campylobacter corcagiensis]
MLCKKRFANFVKIKETSNIALITKISSINKFLKQIRNLMMKECKEINKFSVNR